MTVLCFPTAETLKLALTSAVLPPELARQRVRGIADENGRLWFELPTAFPESAHAALHRLGATLHGPSTHPPYRELTQWAELIPLNPSTGPQHGPALIAVPRQDLIRITSELHRLGAEFQLIEPSADRERVWLSSARLPMYTAHDLIESPSCQIEVYFARSPAIWILAGWEHPLGADLPVLDGHAVLLHPRYDWRIIPRPVISRPPVQFTVSLSVSEREGNVTAHYRIPVNPTLRPDKSYSGNESLWLIPGVPGSRLAELARSADVQLLSELQATILTGPNSDPLLVLWDIGNVSHQSPLSAYGEKYVRYTAIKNLYLPSGHSLSPCLSPESLKRFLGVEPQTLVLLVPRLTGFDVRRIPLPEFRKMVELTKYTVPSPCALKAGWKSSSLLTRPKYVGESVLPSPIADLTTPVQQSPSRDRTRLTPGALPLYRSWLNRIRARLAGRKASQARATSHPGLRSTTNKRPQGRIGKKLSSPESLFMGVDWHARRSTLEQQVLSELHLLSPSKRSGVWTELAEVYSTLGNHSDAAVCWLNTIWDHDQDLPITIANWLKAESRAAQIEQDGQDLQAILDCPSTVPPARTAAAHIVWAAHQSGLHLTLIRHLPRLISLLDTHEWGIPARAVWLARAALADFVGSDTLGLARCRDRLFQRLGTKGPGLDLDAPSFFRFQGETTSDRWQSARDWLARVRDPIHRWLERTTGTGRLQWAGIDAEYDCTSAYTDLILAWGLSRLGDRTRSRTLEAGADAILLQAGGSGVNPAVHRILQAGFAMRIQTAEDGQPDRPGLPPAAIAELNQLDEHGRYAVDKLRTHCRVLEPVDLVNPYRGRDVEEFLGNDTTGEWMLRLICHPDRGPDSSDIRTLQTMIESDPTAATLPRAVFTTLALGPWLGPAAAAVAIAHATQAIDLIPEWVRLSGLPRNSTRSVQSVGSRIMHAAAHYAAYFHLPESFRQTANHALAATTNINSSVIQVIQQTADRFFRTLRRLGLTQPAENLLTSLIDESSTGWRKLGLAVGWFAIGNDDAGIQILNSARERLIVHPLTDIRDRTALAIAYASASGHAPPRIAFGRLEELFLQLGTVSTHGATNRYYTLKPLELVDTVVRAVVSDDFTLGPTVRGWLDDDEYQIRRRITCDLEAWLRGSDITPNQHL